MNMQFIKFLCAGGSGAAANIVSRYAFDIAVPYSHAIVYAYLVGMATTYILSKYFVFDRSNETTSKEFGKFVIVNLFAIVIVWLVSITFSRHLFPLISMNYRPDDIGHIIGVCSTAFSSFFLHKYFTFKNDKKYFIFKNDKKTHQKFEILVILLGLVISLSIAIYNYYGFTLIDHYPWRQTQTAFAIREMMRGGPFLEYRVPVLVYPWSIPLELPLYQFISAKLSQITNVDLETAGRIVSFVGFSGFIYFFRLTLRALGYPSMLRIIVLTLIISSPIYLYWSHSVMIETFALIFVGAYIYFAVKLAGIENKKSRASILYLTALTVAGGLALTAKITTGLPSLLVGGVLYLYVRIRAVGFGNFGNLSSKIISRGLIFVTFNIGALLIAIIWLYYADIIKSTDPTLAHQSSANFAQLKHIISIKKIFGFDPQGLYYSMFSIHTFGIIKYWILLIPIIGMIGQKFILRREIGLYFVIPILLLGIYFLVPLTFGRLYAAHYYYWVANSYLSLFVIGCGAFSIITIVKERYDKFKEIYLAGGFLTVMIISMFAGYQHAYLGPSQGVYTWWRVERTTLVDYLQTNVKNPGLLAIIGRSWEPVMPYYTDRYAYMSMPSDYKLFLKELKRRQDLHPAGDENQIASIIVCEEINEGWKKEQVFKEFGFDTYSKIANCHIYH